MVRERLCSVLMARTKFLLRHCDSFLERIEVRYTNVMMIESILCGLCLYKHPDRPMAMVSRDRKLLKVIQLQVNRSAALKKRLPTLSLINAHTLLKITMEVLYRDRDSPPVNASVRWL